MKKKMIVLMSFIALGTNQAFGLTEQQCAERVIKFHNLVNKSKIEGPVTPDTVQQLIKKTTFGNLEDITKAALLSLDYMLDISRNPHDSLGDMVDQLIFLVKQIGTAYNAPADQLQLCIDALEARKKIEMAHKFALEMDMRYRQITLIVVKLLRDKIDELRNQSTVTVSDQSIRVIKKVLDDYEKQINKKIKRNISINLETLIQELKNTFAKLEGLPEVKDIKKQAQTEIRSDLQQLAERIYNKYSTIETSRSGQQERVLDAGKINSIIAYRMRQGR